MRQLTLLVGAAALTLPACVQTRQYADLDFTPPVGNYNLLVMRPDVSVGSVTTGSNGEPIGGLNLVVDGTHVYLAGVGGMEIIDVSDPSAPKAVGHYGGAWNDIRVVNAGTNVVAFLSAFRSDDRTEVVNVTNPATPTMVSLLAEYSHSLFIQERNAKKELDLATYTDEYRAGLQTIIDAKVAGQDIVAPTIEDAPKVVNLMDALRKSLDTVSSGKKKPIKAAVEKDAKRKRA